MGLSLSSADLERFEAATTTFLSPLDYADLAAWQSACVQSAAALVGADRGVHFLPLPDRLSFIGPSVDPQALDEYMAHWINFDTGFIQERRRKQLEVCHWSVLYDLPALKSTDIYNGFSKRFGLLDCICICNDANEGGPLSPSIVLYHERETSRPFGDRALKLLRLLVPAFRGGTSAVLRLAESGSVLHAGIDALPHPVLVCDFRGHVVHCNAALQAVVSSESRGRLLMEAMRRMAADLIARSGRAAARPPDLSPHAAVSFPGETQQYLLRASLLGEGTPHLGRSVVVTASAQALPVLTDEELRSRYTITAQECRVARCLADRMGNAEIAARLGISAHTARRHTEHVLAKLGVHSRANVRDRLSQK